MYKYIYFEKPEERLCTIWNVVEDEVHFLCQCHKYASQRKTLYGSLEDSNILLSLDSSRTFVELMTNDNKTVMKAIGKYIKECSITWLLKWVQNDISSYDPNHLLYIPSLMLILSYMCVSIVCVCVCECLEGGVISS